MSLILEHVRGGDPGARERLFETVYEELRRMAALRMDREGPGVTLQATALVHEAYLRLTGRSDVEWENRAHFFGAAAEAMRRILIDHHRKSEGVRRGGGRRRVPLRDSIVAAGETWSILDMDEALRGLEEMDPETADIVKYRFFLGLTEEETAELLGVSRSTVTRAWHKARAWLKLKMDAGGSRAPEGTG